MNFSLLKQHKLLLLFVFTMAVSALLLCVTLGSLVTWRELSVFDVVGEGSIALFTAAWAVFLLMSRPPGRVTSMLVIGLSLFMFSALLDVLDEFSHYDDSALWLSMVESIPAGIGMLVMSVALYLWHGEQMALNRQLQRRELWYRSHDQIDYITQLYRADYWRDRAMAMQGANLPAAIVVLDINDFSTFNARYGQNEGDRFLREISQLIIMNLRAIDLACRYAGDRFVLLLPNMEQNQADDLARQLQQSVRNVAFKSGRNTTAIFHSVRVVCRKLDKQHSLDDLLAQMNCVLDNSSEQVA
jgi:diguanylate cyclase (GGDEF)-like protein